MINYDRLSQIVFLLWDNSEDYENSDTQTRIGSSFKDKHRVYNEDGFELEDVLKKYEEDPSQEFLFFIHLDHNNDNKGYHSFFKNSSTYKKFPNLNYYFVSRIPRKEIYESNSINRTIYDWDQLYAEDGVDKTFTPQTISDMRQLNGDIRVKSVSEPSIPSRIDYAIITALEDDEMEKILPMIVKEGSLNNAKHLIDYGHIKGKVNKKVIYSSQQATGMIDAAILSTELLQFKPKYLIMSGVLGGRPDKTKIGDVIVATKTFTIDKGKKDHLGFHHDTESSSSEHAGITNLKRKSRDIQEYIRKNDTTRHSEISIHFGPIGCVRQVIDLEDWFDSNISKMERKAIALEMESYAVTRSCELVNDGLTKALIIKSVMDTTENKDDNGKPYAGWSSAMFIKYILENDII